MTLGEHRKNYHQMYEIIHFYKRQIMQNKQTKNAPKSVFRNIAPIRHSVRLQACAPDTDTQHQSVRLSVTYHIIHV